MSQLWVFVIHWSISMRKSSKHEKLVVHFSSPSHTYKVHSFIHSLIHSFIDSFLPLTRNTTTVYRNTLKIIYNIPTKLFTRSNVVKARKPIYIGSHIKDVGYKKTFLFARI